MIFSFFYDLLLFFSLLIYLPKVLFSFKKYRKSLFQRLFFNKKVIKKTIHDKKVIWIHAVSLGETKAIISLLKKIKDTDPNIYLIISSVTQTGHDEAKRSLSFVDEHIFLPLDFSFNMRRIFKFYHPNTLILVESDFWYNLLRYAKKNNTYTILVNGKISDRSFKRFKFFSFFSRKVFEKIDLFCVQNESYRTKFINLGVGPKKIHITGNLKLSNKPKILSEEELVNWKQNLKIGSQKVITIASTHPNEERSILEIIDKSYKILLAPRHPERFKEVSNFLKENKFSFGLLSDNVKETDQIILINRIGFLNVCYQLSDLSIIGGSFEKIGGHNILESIFVNTPVFFGPHMFAQQDIKEIALSFNCAKEVQLVDLQDHINDYFKYKQISMKEGCTKLTASFTQQMQQTFEEIKNIL